MDGMWVELIPTGGRKEKGDYENWSNKPSYLKSLLDGRVGGSGLNDLDITCYAIIE
jgi:hypothetical protein